MSKLAFGFAAATLVVFSLMALFPNPAKSQGVFEACSDDIASQCSSVVPGHGRLNACLYAHEEKLSEACDEVTADMGDRLDYFFENMRYVDQECRADLAKFCSAVEFSEGRYYSCLKSNSEDLTNECSEVLSSISFAEN